MLLLSSKLILASATMSSPPPFLPNKSMTYSIPLKCQIKGALCTFFLQGNCQKGDSCAFSHDKISEGDDLEYEENVPGGGLILLPAKFKFIAFKQYCWGYDIVAQLQTRSGGLISAPSNKFRKKKTTTEKS